MKIYNSLTNKLEEFKPLSPNKVTIYVCGITPYDTTHLGHAFTYISFDVLVRFLKFKSFNVIYTQNVTDINDRDQDILQRAKEQEISWKKLAEYWTKKFLDSMTALNWTPPNNYLYASKEIPSMIKLIQKIQDKGIAYQKNGSVYLDISKIKDFGKLSKLSKNQMLKKAKDFEEDLDNPDKKHPLDITLWRGSTPSQLAHIPSFDSPFGKGRPASRRGSLGGRPGWHIECSAMALTTLSEQTIGGERSRTFDKLSTTLSVNRMGRTIDIHGGGSDLIFPHHEAEIAQSEAATGKTPFVKYWLHTGVVSYKGAKMSKSKGNLVWVSDLLKKYSANALRFLLLSNHWQRDWEYREEDLKKAQKNVDIIESVISKKERSQVRLGEGRSESEDMPKAFTEIMDNNLDTPKALQLLHKIPNREIYEILGFQI